MASFIANTNPLFPRNSQLFQNVMAQFSPYKTNVFPKTALHWLSYFSARNSINIEVAEYLINKGANVNARNVRDPS